MMSDLQTVSITIGILTACVTVVIGVINSIQSNRDAKQQRMTQIYLQIAEKYSDVATLEAIRDLSLIEYTDFEDYQRKYGELSERHLPSIWVLGSFYETVGHLVRRGLFDVDMLDDNQRNVIKLYWEKLQVAYEGRRQWYNDPSYGSSIEYLYNEFKRQEQ
ncbi:MAG: hypothetical protein NWE83_06200 [Candidatus Bathyarchaeota archaeon]|nr:hypothetical protein [Candidatus Bathyarchaeota archaeon]